MEHEIHYINTDLDLVAPLDLGPLAEGLSQQGLYTFHVLQHANGTWSARFETEEPFQEPDSNIAAMLTAIEALEEPAKSLWVACTSREFDIGYNCGREPWGFNQQLSPATIKRMAQYGASLIITLYPVIQTEASQAAVAILKNDKSIKSYIGKYKGYLYHYVRSPSPKKPFTEVKVSLTGTKGSVYIHCQMQLIKQAEWMIKEILNKKEGQYPSRC